MLLRRDPGQGLEPMGKVGGTMFHGPVLHSVRYSIGHFIIQAAAFVDRLFQRGVDLVGKPCFHDTVVKDQTAEIIRYCAHHAPLLFLYLHAKKASRRLPSKTPLPLMGEIIYALLKFVNLRFTQFYTIFAVSKADFMILPCHFPNISPKGDIE